MTLEAEVAMVVDYLLSHGIIRTGDDAVAAASAIPAAAAARQHRETTRDQTSRGRHPDNPLLVTDPAELEHLLRRSRDAAVIAPEFRCGRERRNARRRLLHAA